MKARIAKKILGRYHYRMGGRLPKHYQIKELHRCELKGFANLNESLTIPWYIYDKKTGLPVKVSFAEWHWWGFLCGNRFIKTTYLQPGERVSTICLGIDHDFSLGETDAPVIFETMWFKDGWSGERQERARALQEALKHHEDMVNEAKACQAEIDALVEGK